MVSAFGNTVHPSFYYEVFWEIFVMMMMFCNLSRSAVVFASLCVLSLSAGVGNAGIISPEYSTFGSFPAATFGGNGIDNSSVAIKTISNAGKTITLGLTATQRYSNPPVTNNGAGVFSALPGEDASNPGYAGWNFNYYINVEGTGSSISDYRYRMFYDFDPATANDGLGVLRLPSSFDSLSRQGSLNLGFGYFDSTVNFPFFGLDVTQPTFPSFDPTAIGEYAFSLVAYTRSGAWTALGATTIIVRVGNAAAVPEPATMAMFSMLTLGAAGAYRRKKRLAAALC